MGKVLAKPIETLISLPVSLALEDSKYVFDGGSRWSPDRAKAILKQNGIAIEDLLQRLKHSLIPVDTDWLQKRLRLLWNSSTPSKNLHATAWLHETSRLLQDIPRDILSISIDEAIKSSEYMPNVGAIRKIADPVLQQRMRQAYRLEVIVYPKEKIQSESSQQVDENERQQVSDLLAELTNEFRLKSKTCG